MERQLKIAVFEPIYLSSSIFFDGELEYNAFIVEPIVGRFNPLCVGLARVTEILGDVKFFSGEVTLVAIISKKNLAAFVFFILFQIPSKQRKSNTVQYRDIPILSYSSHTV